MCVAATTSSTGRSASGAKACANSCKRPGESQAAFDRYFADRGANQCALAYLAMVATNDLDLIRRQTDLGTGVVSLARAVLVTHRRCGDPQGAVIERRDKRVGVNE